MNTKRQITALRPPPLFIRNSAIHICNCTFFTGYPVKINLSENKPHLGLLK